MAVAQTEIALDMRARDFRLPATDGRSYALKDVAGAEGDRHRLHLQSLPYVKAVIDRFVADSRLLMGVGVGVAAISSNDAASYPEDSFPKMGAFAKKHGFPFPYLHDETQAVARAYGAVCTPDFFGFDRELKLKYRGRLDEGRASPPPPNARRRASGSDARDGRRPPGTGELGPLDRLLDQVEGAGMMAGGFATPRRLGPGPALRLAAMKTARQFSGAHALTAILPARANVFSGLGPGLVPSSKSRMPALPIHSDIMLYIGTRHRAARSIRAGAPGLQLAIAPCIVFSAASTWRQVFASSLSSRRSHVAARWAASAMARSPWASISPRA